MPPEGPVELLERYEDAVRGGDVHTLRLLKGALLNAGLQGLVEERVEHLLANIDGVVGADILLQGLTAGVCVSEMS